MFGGKGKGEGEEREREREMREQSRGGAEVRSFWREDGMWCVACISAAVVDERMDGWMDGWMSDLVLVHINRVRCGIDPSVVNT